MKYACEYCGKTYDTESSALNCEKACKTAKEEKEKKTKERETRQKELLETLDKYNKDYGTSYSLYSSPNSLFGLGNLSRFTLL